jgi:hypothetical protein
MVFVCQDLPWDVHRVGDFVDFCFDHVNKSEDISFGSPETFPERSDLASAGFQLTELLDDVVIKIYAVTEAHAEGG